MNAMNKPPKAPLLSGGNTIRQAEKPSQAHVTIPYGPGSITISEHEAVLSKNAELQSEKLKLEDQLFAISLKLQRAEEELYGSKRSLRIKATATVTRK